MPSPAVAIPVDADLAARITGGAAFGFTRADPAPASADAATLAQIDARIRLLGLAREQGAGKAGESQALFKIDKRILWLKTGDELDPGVRLAAIEPDGVRLSANGREVRLPLRVDKPAPASGVAGAPGAAPAAAVAARPGVIGPGPIPGAIQGGSVVAAAPATAPVTAAGPGGTQAVSPRSGSSTDICKLAPDQRSRAYVLRPEIVDSVMRERGMWSELLKPTANGLVVQNPGGTGAMLGLYGNDVLVKADGAQLASVDDVLRLVLQPLARNESVIVTGSRGGQPREWIYAGMNCINR